MFCDTAYFNPGAARGTSSGIKGMPCRLVWDNGNWRSTSLQPINDVTKRQNHNRQLMMSLPPTVACFDSNVLFLLRLIHIKAQPLGLLHAQRINRQTGVIMPCGGRIHNSKRPAALYHTQTGATCKNGCLTRCRCHRRATNMTSL